MENIKEKFGVVLVYTNKESTKEHSLCLPSFKHLLNYWPIGKIVEIQNYMTSKLSFQPYNNKSYYEKNISLNHSITRTSASSWKERKKNE